MSEKKIYISSMKKLFKYIRELIDGDTNDDLKDFIAIVMSFTLVIVVAYSMYVAETDGARLNIILSLIAFISALTGMKTYKEVKSIKKDAVPEN